MSLRWEQMIVEARDPEALGRWWCEALGWVVVNADPAELEIRASADRTPGLLFEPVDEVKATKRRKFSESSPT